jgi:hypothetical protein
MKTNASSAQWSHNLQVAVICALCCVELVFLLLGSKNLTCIVVYFYGFRLDHNSGQLYIIDRIMEGKYKFRVKVRDVVWKHEVVSTVTVTVKDIRDDAIHNSGSVRFHGQYFVSWLHLFQSVLK